MALTSGMMVTIKDPVKITGVKTWGGYNATILDSDGPEQYVTASPSSVSLNDLYETFAQITKNPMQCNTLLVNPDSYKAFCKSVIAMEGACAYHRQQFTDYGGWYEATFGLPYEMQFPQVNISSRLALIGEDNDRLNETGR